MLPPPNPNQKWLSSCLARPQPSVLLPAADDILHMIHISPGSAPSVLPRGSFRLRKLTQAETLKFPDDRCRLGAFPMSIRPLIPLKSNACPTTPRANVTPPFNVPWLAPALSFAFPSARHQ